VGEVASGTGTIGHNSVLVSRERIQIGNDCMLAFCYVLTSITGSRPDAPIPGKACGRPVMWETTLGARSFILRRHHRRWRSYGSVVTEDVPPYTVVAGSPARVKKR
jgi:acetyltransferase-like isoleucine patch superfamily enzyme